MPVCVHGAPVCAILQLLARRLRPFYCEESNRQRDEGSTHVFVCSCDGKKSHRCASCMWASRGLATNTTLCACPLGMCWCLHEKTWKAAYAALLGM